MSDILQAFDFHKFEQKISLTTDKCLNYARKHNVHENDIVFAVKIPYEHLMSWYDIKAYGKLAEFSYVEILNAFLSQHSIKIQGDCERLNGILRRCCGEINSKYRKLNTRDHPISIEGQGHYHKSQKSCKTAEHVSCCFAITNRLTLPNCWAPPIDLLVFQAVGEKIS